MMRNMIFFDVDGTIMDEWGHVPDSAREAICKARKKGNLCFVNTGRPFTHIEDFIVDIGFDGYVCSCGQHLLMNGESVFRAPTSPQVCGEIVKKAIACRLDAYYEAEGGMRQKLLHEPNPHMRIYLDRMIQRGFPVMQDPEEEGYCFDKFCVWAHADSDMDAFAAFAETCFSLIDRGGGMYECIQRGYSKETGIRVAAERLGIPLSDCYAIGDSANDLPMLRCVAHGIAMGSAPAAVKAQVEYVTDELENDGLAHALEHFGLC